MANTEFHLHLHKNKIHFNFRSQTNKAYVYFYTDYSVNRRGFKLDLSYDYQGMET